MKILSLVLLLMASLAFVLLGCTDNSSPIVPTDQTVAATTSSGSLGKMGEELHSATGNAHWRMIGTQTRVRFSFSAIQHAGDRFTGEVRNNDEGPTLKFHGKVYDLKVEGNRAKICWKMTSGAWTPPDGTVLDLTGMIMAVVVVDNGEGKKSTGPDQVSMIWGDPPGTYYDAISMTVDQLNALGIDDYLDKIEIITGMTPTDYVPAIDMGSVKVR